MTLSTSEVNQNVVYYEQFLQRADLFESTDAILYRSLIEKCIALIKTNPVEFLNHYPKRINELETLENRLIEIKKKYAKDLEEEDYIRTSSFVSFISEAAERAKTLASKKQFDQVVIVLDECIKMANDYGLKDQVGILDVQKQLYKDQKGVFEKRTELLNNLLSRYNYHVKAQNLLVINDDCNQIISFSMELGRKDLIEQFKKVLNETNTEIENQASLLSTLIQNVNKKEEEKKYLEAVEACDKVVQCATKLNNNNLINQYKARSQTNKKTHFVMQADSKTKLKHFLNQYELDFKIRNYLSAIEDCDQIIELAPLAHRLDLVSEYKENKTKCQFQYDESRTNNRDKLNILINKATKLQAGEKFKEMFEVLKQITDLALKLEDKETYEKFSLLQHQIQLQLDKQQKEFLEQLGELNTQVDILLSKHQIADAIELVQQMVKLSTQNDIPELIKQYKSRLKDLKELYAQEEKILDSQLAQIEKEIDENLKLNQNDTATENINKILMIATRYKRKDLIDKYSELKAIYASAEQLAEDDQKHKALEEKKHQKEKNDAEQETLKKAKELEEIKRLEDEKKAKEIEEQKKVENWKKSKKLEKQKHLEDEKKVKALEEEKRLEDEKKVKALEEEKRLEDEKKAKALEEAKRLEDEKKAKELEEAKRLEDEKKAKELEEAKRLEDEKKAKELEEAKRLEDEKKAKELEEAKRLDDEKKSKTLEEAKRLEDEKKAKELEEAKRLEDEKKAKELEEAKRLEDEKKAKDLEETKRSDDEKKAKELEEAKRLEDEKKAKDLEETKRSDDEKKAKALEEEKRLEEEKKINAIEEEKRLEDKKKVIELEEEKRLEDEKKAIELGEIMRLEDEKKAKALEEQKRLEDEKKAIDIEKQKRYEDEKKAKELEEQKRLDEVKKQIELVKQKQPGEDKTQKIIDDQKRFEKEMKRVELETQRRLEEKKKKRDQDKVFQKVEEKTPILQDKIGKEIDMLQNQKDITKLAQDIQTLQPYLSRLVSQGRFLSPESLSKNMIDILFALGLSDQQINIYFLCCGIGLFNASDIVTITKSSIDNTEIEFKILKDFGLLQEIDVENHLFFALPPYSIIEKQLSNINDEIKQLKSTPLTKAGMADEIEQKQKSKLATIISSLKAIESSSQIKLTEEEEKLTETVKEIKNKELDKILSDVQKDQSTLFNNFIETLKQESLEKINIFLSDSVKNKTSDVDSKNISTKIDEISTKLDSISKKIYNSLRKLQLGSIQKSVNSVINTILKNEFENIKTTFQQEFTKTFKDPIRQVLMGIQKSFEVEVNTPLEKSMNKSIELIEKKRQNFEQSADSISSLFEKTISNQNTLLNSIRRKITTITAELNTFGVKTENGIDLEINDAIFSQIDALKEDAEKCQSTLQELKTYSNITTTSLASNTTKIGDKRELLKMFAEKTILHNNLLIQSNQYDLAKEEIEKASQILMDGQILDYQQQFQDLLEKIEKSKAYDIALRSKTSDKIEPIAFSNRPSIKELPLKKKLSLRRKVKEQ